MDRREHHLLKLSIKFSQSQESINLHPKAMLKDSQPIFINENHTQIIRLRLIRSMWKGNTLTIPIPPHTHFFDFNELEEDTDDH